MFDADAFASKTDTVMIGGKEYEFPKDVPAEVRLQALAKAHDLQSKVTDEMDEAEETRLAWDMQKDLIAIVLKLKTPDFDASLLDQYGPQTLSAIWAHLSGVDPDSPLVKAAFGEQAPKTKKGKKKKSK